MNTKSPPTPPPHYGRSQNIFNDIDDSNRTKLFFRLNFIALFPLFIGLLLLWAPYQFYRLLGLKWVIWEEPDWGTAVHILLYILIIFGSIVVHELIHALIIKQTGHKPVLAIHRGFLTAGIPTGDYLQRNHYLLITITPLISMTIFGGLLLLILPVTFGQPLLIALLFNFPASLGDLLVAQRVRRYPSNTIFASNGIEIYAYEPT